MVRYGQPVVAGAGGGDIFFVPQKPYLPLGTLRDIVLYPVWRRSDAAGTERAAGWMPRWLDTLFGKGGFTQAEEWDVGAGEGGQAAGEGARPIPTDEEVAGALRDVGLGGLLERYGGGEGAGPGSALDAETDWSAVLSLGEQQRLAFARLLLARPSVRTGVDGLPAATSC